MYKYQNISDSTQSIVVAGDVSPRIVKPGESVLSSVVIENANFKYLGDEQTDTSQINGTQVTPENAITNAVPVENKEEEN